MSSYTDETLMPFGRHKGTPLKDVPDDYLDWLHRQKWIVDHIAMYDYLQENIDAIKANLKAADRGNNRS